MKYTIFQRAMAVVAVVTVMVVTASVPASAQETPDDDSPTESFHGYQPVDFPPGLDGVHGEISRLYLALLDREPEADGLDYWVDRRMDGMPLTEMIAFFRVSPEFQQTFGQMVNAPTADWVEFMYVEVLERPSDAAGNDFWVDLVDSGRATKEDLILFFADSVEFRVSTGTGIEGFLATVDGSEAAYGVPTSYRYVREVPTPWASIRTTIVVVDGVVTERAYETRWHDPAHDVSWVETGDEIGTHDGGYDPLTLPELHDLCREELIGFHPTRVQLTLELDDQGRFTACAGWDPFLADALPGEAIYIVEYEVLTP